MYTAVENDNCSVQLTTAVYKILYTAVVIFNCSVQNLSPALEFWLSATNRFLLHIQMQRKKTLMRDSHPEQDVTKGPLTGKITFEVLHSKELSNFYESNENKNYLEH